MEIKVIRRILEAGTIVAEANRRLLKEKGIVSFNFIGSPGAGKTSLIINLVNRLRDRYNIGIIEGDLATTRDAERIAKTGVPVVQINTEGACHLDANLVGRALEGLPLADLDIIFIENVGNLVCPTAFDLGEDYKIGVLSVPEGDDKPEKYPVIVKTSSAIVLNKLDMLPYFKFERKRFHTPIRKLRPDMPIFEISCETGEGIEKFASWLTLKIAEMKGGERA